MESDLKGELTCPVCMELFTRPLRLGCGHSYCRNCLLAMSKQAPPVGANQIRRPGSISCPECRRVFDIPSTGVDSFPVDFKLSKLVDVFQKMELSYQEVSDQARGSSESMNKDLERAKQDSNLESQTVIAAAETRLDTAATETRLESAAIETRLESAATETGLDSAAISGTQHEERLNAHQIIPGSESLDSVRTSEAASRRQEGVNDAALSQQLTSVRRRARRLAREESRRLSNPSDTSPDTSEQREGTKERRRPRRRKNKFMKFVSSLLSLSSSSDDDDNDDTWKTSSSSSSDGNLYRAPERSELPLSGSMASGHSDTAGRSGSNPRRSGGAGGDDGVTRPRSELNANSETRPDQDRNQSNLERVPDGGAMETRRTGHVDVSDDEMVVVDVDGSVLENSDAATASSSQTGQTQTCLGADTADVTTSRRHGEVSSSSSTRDPCQRSEKKVAGNRKKKKRSLFSIFVSSSSSLSADELPDVNDSDDELLTHHRVNVNRKTSPRDDDEVLQ